MAVHELLITRRECNHMTQSQVAKAASISRAHYTNIELEIRRPRPETAQKIARVLGFDWKLFYEESPS